MKPGAAHTGKLVFVAHHSSFIASKLAIRERVWNQVDLERDGLTIEVYLNGQKDIEIGVISNARTQATDESWFLGGRADSADKFEGKIVEVAIYDRTLSPLEIADHFRLAALARHDL